MKTSTHLAFAGRVALVFLVTATVFATVWFLIFDLNIVDEPLRFAFWTVIGAHVLGATAVSFTGLARLAVAIRLPLTLIIGAGAGLVFMLAVVLPWGFSSGPFELPIILIWPVAAAVAFSYAISDLAGAPRARTHPIALLGGLFLGLALMTAVKAGLAGVREPLDFARYRTPDPLPRLQPVLAVEAMASEPCRQIAVLPDMQGRDTASARVEAIGVYADLREDSAGRLFGRRVFLWRSANVLHGVMEQYSGAEPNIGKVAPAFFRGVDATLDFRVVYEDGYFEEFQGRGGPANLTGTVRTSQVACANLESSLDTTTMIRDTMRSNRMLGLRDEVRVRDLDAHITTMIKSGNRNR